MKTLVSISAIAGAAMLFAAPASAQIAGGLGGQVGGSVGVGAPSTAPLTGQVGQSVRETRSRVRNARPNVEANANASANADARANRSDARLDTRLTTGATVQSSDGATLGSIVDVTRNSAGRATAFVVRSADGTLRTVPAANASFEGGTVVTGQSERQFLRRRADRPTPGDDRRDENRQVQQ